MVEGSGFGIWGLGFQVCVWGCGVWGLEFKVSCFVFRVSGLGSKYSCSGDWDWVRGVRCRVGGLGCRV